MSSERLSKATFWGPVVAATILIIGPIIIYFLSNSSKPESESCKNIKRIANEYVIRLQQCFSSSSDTERQMDLAFWKKKCEDIGKYDCDEISRDSLKIDTAFRMTIQQLSLCSNASSSQR